MIAEDGTRSTADSGSSRCRCRACCIDAASLRRIARLPPAARLAALRAHRPPDDGIASTSATHASSRIHPIARHSSACRVARHLAPWLVAALLRPGASPRRHRAARRRRRRRPFRRRRRQRRPRLPAGRVVRAARLGRRSVHAAWPAFIAGCRARRIADAPGAVAGRLRGRRRDRRHASRAVRAFFESHFIPYQVAAADGRDSGLVTGYYEPLLAAAARQSARYPVPLYAAARRPARRRPRRAPSRARRTCACAAASRAGAWFRTGRAPRSRRASAASRQGDRLGRRSGRGVLPADPGLGRIAARRRQRRARRLRRPERPSLPLDRPLAGRARRDDARAGLDAGHRDGAGATRTSCPRCSTRIRATCSFARCHRRCRHARSGDRRPGRRARRAALRERTIAVDTRSVPLGRAGLPRDDLSAVGRSRWSG